MAGLVHCASMTADLAAFERVLARTTWRLRVQRALEWGAWTAFASTTAALLGQLAAKLGWFTRGGHAVGPADAFAWMTAALVLASAAGVVAAMLPVPEERAAAAIDRAGELTGRARAALECRRRARRQRTPFQEASLRDADARTAAVPPGRAAPIRRPRATWLALVALGACGVLAAWHGSAARAPAEAKAARGGAGRVLSEDDLAGFRAALAALQLAPDLSPGLRDELARYAAVLAQLEAGALGRDQALSQLLALEARLAHTAEEPSPGDRAALSALGAQLAADPALAEAQRTGDAARAAQALKALARALRDRALDARERERLARALEAVRRERESAAERAKDQDTARAAEREGLLKPPASARAGADQGERNLLARPERELESLHREQARPRAHRQLERLSRSLARAGAALPKNEAEAAAALDESSDALERFERDAQSAEQRRALEREVGQLRELLQRGGGRGPADARSGPPQAQAPQSDSQQARSEELERRRERFRLRAQGDAGAAQLRLPGETQAHANADGGRAGPTSGASAQGSELSLGEPGADGAGGAGGAELELPGTAVPGAREALETMSGQGGAAEHDETRLQAPSRARAGYEDRQLAGAAGAGPTRSQVILGASEGGFASASYRKVYGDYRAHAEEWIARDDVPPGYRYYVRRYFQLVRPRGVPARAANPDARTNGRPPNTAAPQEARTHEPQETR